MIGIYVHVPFCSVRCSYCDFYLVAGRRASIPEFVRALSGEIEGTGPPLRGRRADSVHFGGGTPSLLSADDLDAVLRGLGRSFRLEAGAEIGLEANPEDVEPAWLDRIAAAGVNRICIGVQSLEEGMLRRMRRPHTAERALAAVADAVRSPVPGVGIDLMLGLPGQRSDRAVHDLERLIAMDVSHVSLYLLEIHGRTRLGREVDLGRASPMPDDAAAGLYERASSVLSRAGFEHYEISNFARPGHRSRHNVKYWTDEEYAGFGPSAHSYVGGQRYSNAPDLRGYVRTGGAGIVRIEDRQTRTVRGYEALCAGLRLREGVDLEALRSRYGASLPGPEDPRIAPLLERGLVIREGARLRIAPSAFLVSNEILVDLLREARAAAAVTS